MTDMTQDPSAGHSARPAGAPPPIPGTSGGQAATEANRATVRAAFQAWQASTDTITSLFAPDMVWRIEGHSAASKEYGNRQEFISEVLAPFGARFGAVNSSVPCASAPPAALRDADYQPCSE